MKKSAFIVVIILSIFWLMHEPVQEGTKSAERSPSSLSKAVLKESTSPKEIVSVPSKMVETLKQKTKQKILTGFKNLDKEKVLNSISLETINLCEPKKESFCYDVCLDPDGNPTRCEIKMAEREMETLCLNDNPECEPNRTSIQEYEKIVSSKENFIFQNNTCYANAKDCKEIGREVTEFELQTFLTPNKIDRYLKDMKVGDFLKRILSLEEKEMETVVDCGLAVVPEYPTAEEIYKLETEGVILEAMLRCL